VDIRNLLSLAGVTLLIGAAGWYWGLETPVPVSAPQERHPDYSINKIEVFETDHTGQVSKHLRASSLQHFSLPHEEAEITQPTLALYDNGQIAWQVSAQMGRSLNHNNEYHLESHVEASRLLPMTTPVKLTSDHIQIFPKEERLSSDALVTIKTPQAQLKTRGIDANLKAGTLMLRKEVQGYYAPPTH
jgi:lipopolysaccharide export system protein LptC